MTDFEARFWAKVAKAGPDECWTWIAARSPLGYGRFSIRNRKVTQAHRVAFFLTRGSWPKDFACHSCDNPPCVNPKHVWDGTAADNNRDMKEKGRANGRPPTGIKNHKSKLTAERVAAMRSEYRTGNTSYPKLGKKYGVSMQSAWAAVTGKNWGHV